MAHNFENLFGGTPKKARAPQKKKSRLTECLANTNFCMKYIEYIKAPPIRNVHLFLFMRSRFGVDAQTFKKHVDPRITIDDGKLVTFLEITGATKFLHRGDFIQFLQENQFRVIQFLEEHNVRVREKHLEWVLRTGFLLFTRHLGDFIQFLQRLPQYINRDVLIRMYKDIAKEYEIPVKAARRAYGVTSSRRRLVADDDVLPRLV